MLNDFFTNFYPAAEAKRVVLPANSPITLDELKRHCRIDDNNSDTILQDYLDSATEYCERDSGRVFITQTWKLTLPYFQSALSPPHQPLRSVFAVLPLWYRDVIPLPHPPLQSVTNVSYIDSGGTQRTLTEGTDYLVDTTRIYGSIRPPMNKVWPVTQINNPAAVSISYVAGYGDDPSTVPAVARQAVRVLAAFMNEYREPTIVGTIVADVSLGVKALLDHIRIIEA